MVSPIKVMIISLEYTPALSGGVGTHVLELAAGLGRHGHEVTVLAYSSGRTTMLNRSNVTVHRISPGADSLAKAAKLSMVQGILSFNEDLASYGQSLIQESRPDIIHFYNWITFAAAHKLQQLFKIPVIGRVSYLSDPVERWWGQIPDPEIARQEEHLFKEASAFISVSRSLRTLINTIHGVSEDQIDVVYNGLDVQQFMKPDLARDEIYRLRSTVAESGQKVVLFAGRLNPMKGISALFASAARVVKEAPNIRYVLIGEADSRDFPQVIDQLFQEYPVLRGKIKLLGRVPRQQLAIMYRIADIFLMPSIYEPFGWVAIEAMAAGLPVVSVNVGGPAEIVLHEQTGLLVPTHARESGLHEVDVEQLAEAQIRLLNDEALAKEFGDNGRQRVMTTFSLEKMVQSTINAYRRTMA